MRRIIARDDHPLLSAIGRDFEIMMLPHPVIIGHADFLILIQPLIGEILNEAEILEGMNTHIIVFTESYREMLLKALFSSVSVINPEDRDAGEKLSDILKNEIHGQKEIRFTENEKRTLAEMPFGLCNKELSKRLGMTERQIRRIKEHIMAKTGLVSSEQLLVYSLLRCELSTRSSLNI